MSKFNYYNKISDLNEDKDNVFIISKGVTSESEFFDILYFTLKLPDYFGSNWDALKDAITDREALLPILHIVHLDLPFVDDEQKAFTYLRILKIANDYLNSNPEPYQTPRGLVERQIDFEVWFPKELEEKVEGLLMAKLQS